MCGHHTWADNKACIFLSPKMSRQLRVVDLIQQHLPTRRRHHQSRLLFCTFKDQLKTMFGHNMKLSMIPTSSAESTSSFQGLKNPTWPNTHVPRKIGFHNQLWNKGLDMISSSNNTRISILTTSWMVISHSQVLNYQLIELTQTNKNLSIGISRQSEDSLTQVDTWTTCDHRQDIHVEPRAS